MRAMTDAALDVNDRYRALSLDAGQTDLPYDFPLLRETDLTVYLERGGEVTKLTDGIDFIFPLGLGNDDGGTAQLVAPAKDGDIYRLVGLEAIERVSDFMQQHGFDTDKLDADIDKLTRIAQEARRDIGRSLKVAFGDANLDPLPAPEAGKALEWRPDGKGLRNSETSIADLDAATDEIREGMAAEAGIRAAADAALRSLIGQAGPIEVPLYDTRLAASLAYIKPTIDIIRTGGFTVAGDGGAALYKRVGAEPAHAGKFQSADGTWWEIAEKVLTPQMLGAVGDGVADDTDPFKALLDIASDIIIPNNTTVLITSNLTLPSGRSISGGGRIVAGPPSGFSGVDNHASLLLATEEDDISIDDIEIDISAWTSLPPSSASARCIVFRRSTNFKVKNCRFSTTGGAVAVIGCKDYEVSSNDITCTQPGASESGYADGVIDNWVEWDIDTERAVIHGNKIRGGGWARWGIMVTALTATLQMDVRSLVISDNIVLDTFYDGIWVMGRNAILDGYTISGNICRNGRKGISVSDSSNFVVSGNVIENTPSVGIDLFSEPVEGADLGCVDGIVANNKLHNVGNTPGAETIAIWLHDGSTGNLISGNSITGTTHHYGIVTDAASLDNRVVGNKIKKGRGPKITQLALGNKVDGATYGPTLTEVQNVASSGAWASHFFATDGAVMVYFNVFLTPSAASTVIELSMSLPIEATLAGSQSLHGSCSSNKGEAGVVSPDTVNNRATIVLTPADTAQRSILGSFSYLLT